MKKEDFKLADILLPYQRRFVSSAQRKKIWVSSRQVGKSFSIAFLMCSKVLQKKGTLGLCVSTGQRAAAELLKKVKQMAEAVKVLSKGTITYTYNADSVTFSTGSRIVSLPSNPDGLRGYTASVVCIDEAAFVPFIDEIYQAIAPTLTRDNSSELILCSTPAGRQGLFYDLLQNADDSWYVQVTTIEDAVGEGLKVDVEELKKLVGDPEVFQQEYMCVFSKEFGSFIDPDIIDFVDDVPEDQGGYYLGMDIGRKHDRTALTILKAVKDKIYLENALTLSKCEYAEQIRIVKDLNEKYRFQAGLVDEGGIGSAVAEQITKTISSRLCGLQFTGSNKTPMYEAVRARIFDHSLLFKRDFKDQVVQDFKNVSRIVTEDGKVKFAAGRDAAGHSDLTSSLALALESVKRNPMNFKAPQTYVNFSQFGSRSHIFGR